MRIGALVLLSFMLFVGCSIVPVTDFKPDFDTAMSDVATQLGCPVPFTPTFVVADGVTNEDPARWNRAISAHAPDNLFVLRSSFGTRYNGAERVAAFQRAIYAFIGVATPLVEDWKFQPTDDTIAAARARLKCQ